MEIQERHRAETLHHATPKTRTLSHSQPRQIHTTGTYCSNEPKQIFPKHNSSQKLAHQLTLPAIQHVSGICSL